MIQVIGETERTLLREITPDDAEQAYLLNSDPLVIQFTGDDAFADVDAARDFLLRYDHYQRYGFGRWAVIRKTDDAFLGWCGLKYSADVQEYDVGFRFFQKYWQHGYATETAAYCLQLGFTRWQMPEIVGRAMCDNLASIRVLEKIGMQWKSEHVEDGHTWVCYGITADTYTQKFGTHA